MVSPCKWTCCKFLAPHCMHHHMLLITRSMCMQQRRKWTLALLSATATIVANCLLTIWLTFDEWEGKLVIESVRHELTCSLSTSRKESWWLSLWGTNLQAYEWKGKLTVEAVRHELACSSNKNPINGNLWKSSNGSAPTHTSDQPLPTERELPVLHERRA